MNEYRFAIPASVMFTVRADTREEAEKIARSICDTHQDGEDLDNWDEDGEDYRVYISEPLPDKLDLEDFAEDVGEERAL